MKKTIYISITFLILSFIIFSASFFYEQQKEYNNLYYAGETDQIDFNTYYFTMINNDQKLEKVFDDIEAVIQDYDANLYTMGYSSEQKTTIKYMYCMHPELFDGLVVENGRFLTQEDNRTSNFVSTEPLLIDGQIGQVSGFYDAYIFTTIYSGLDTGFFNREFTLVLPKEKSIDSFIAEMSSKGYAVQELQDNKVNLQSTQNYYWLIKWGAIISGMIILFIIIFWDVINSSRKIGIKKMMGYSVKELWIEQVPVAVVSELIVSIFVLVGTFFLLFGKISMKITSFYAEVIRLYIVTLIISVIVISLPFIFTIRIRVVDILKNKQPLSSALWFNTGVKVLVSVVLICFLCQGYLQMLQIESRYKSSFQKWESTRQYAVVQSVVTTEELYNPFSDENIERFALAYSDFNKNGAIYADFSCYDNSFQEWLNEMAIVNPNYLKQYPVYDVNGIQVDIDEQEQDLIILAPAKYRNLEKDIEGRYEKTALGGQKVKIIWIKDDQSLFSIQLSINPDNGNCVADPLVMVVTENNVGSSWWGNITASVLFIPVQSIETLNMEVDQIFAKYFDLTKIAFPSYSVYSIVESQIQNSKQNMVILGVLMAILFCALCFIVIQNVRNYFEKNNKKLFVMRFMGIKCGERYRKLILESVFSYLIIIIICRIIMADRNVYLFSFLLMVIELIVSSGFILRCEKKNIARAIKGG